MQFVRPTMQNTVIAMRSRRRGPLATLKNFQIPDGMDVMIVADPIVYDDHRRMYRAQHRIQVILGYEGLAPQAAMCYLAAAKAGYDWVFRLDDDLSADTFVHKDGRILSLTQVIRAAMKAAAITKTTLVGFANTSRRDWMTDKMSRTYGLIHGGAQLHVSTRHPKQFIDIELPRFEDVYRSCSHRARDGAVGRVGFIGVDKSKSSNAKTNQSVTKDSVARRKRAIRMILEQWSDYVTCNGMRTIHAGQVAIPNWRMKRHAEYVP